MDFQLHQFKEKSASYFFAVFRENSEQGGAMSCTLGIQNSFELPSFDGELELSQFRP